MKIRLQSAARVAALHLMCSAAVVFSAAIVVFGFWFPFPYDELIGAYRLFTLIALVDLVCGPILTFVLYSPSKTRHKWYFDLGLIVLMQLVALSYGVSQAAAARPVFLSFEGNRFRVVQMVDIDPAQLPQAPAHLQHLSYWGPLLIGARLSKSTDPDFLASLNRSMRGEHPSFRPSRWIDFAAQKPLLLAELEPFSKLSLKNTTRRKDIQDAVTRIGLPEERLGYLPLVMEPISDWVVIVDRQTVEPVSYLHVDGW
jgi:hypothetical protein